MKSILSILAITAIAAFFSFQPGPQNQIPDLSSGRCVVQINSDWNKQNNYRWMNIPSVKYYYLSLDKFPELKSKMRIKSVPTVIVLQDGREVKRFEGGLMMQVSVPQQEIIK
jgi:thiol-disulfide isomerase/thioredoxin